MTQHLNRGEKHTIMNGYQNYLKRMSQVIPDELAASKALGFNIGIKMVRGAYMTEERHLAMQEGRESPIWESLEQTHECYNTNLSACLEHLKDQPHGAVLLGSHNLDSVKLAKEKCMQLGVTVD